MMGILLCYMPNIDGNLLGFMKKMSLGCLGCLIFVGVFRGDLSGWGNAWTLPPWGVQWEYSWMSWDYVWKCIYNRTDMCI